MSCRVKHVREAVTKSKEVTCDWCSKKFHKCDTVCVGYVGPAVYLCREECNPLLTYLKNHVNPARPVTHAEDSLLSGLLLRIRSSSPCDRHQEVRTIYFPVISYVLQLTELDGTIFEPFRYSEIWCLLNDNDTIVSAKVIRDIRYA
jgi:hypothetical protein